MLHQKIDFQIIANLISGSGDAKKTLDKLTAFLDRHNLTYDVLAITKPTPISQLPEDGRIQKGVICLGGDGTVSETVGFVLNQKVGKPIAIIPAGTANIISSTLGLDNCKNNFDFLLKNNFKKVDIGVAEYDGEKNYFILGMGLGFEENFLRLTKEKFKKRLGVFSYIFAAISELLSLKKIPIKITHGDEEKSLDICLLTVLNLQPSILKLFPLFKSNGIVCDDRMFNIFYVEYRNYIQAFLGTLLFHLLGELHFGLVKSFCAKEFTLESPGICGTQLDGEIRSCLPVKVSFHSEPSYFWIP
ncbi:MAG: diacylglycerol/lipid kinase family protein [Patescibacteria group bacterium]|jgi:diacylglycerol kinase (ATP)